MEQGYSPQEIIDWLVNNDAENNPSIRQYGIISHFEGGSRSAYTGENCFDYKSHILGPDYSIQGNILLNQSVLDSMEYAFVNSTGNFEDKLFSALMAANISGPILDAPHMKLLPYQHLLELQIYMTQLIHYTLI